MTLGASAILSGPNGSFSVVSGKVMGSLCSIQAGGPHWLHAIADIKLYMFGCMIGENVCVYVREAQREHADLHFSEFERTSHAVGGTSHDNRNDDAINTAMKKEAFSAATRDDWAGLR